MRQVPRQALPLVLELEATAANLIATDPTQLADMGHPTLARAPPMLAPMTLS
jgi:hypothetical protein